MERKNFTGNFVSVGMWDRWRSINSPIVSWLTIFFPLQNPSIRAMGAKDKSNKVILIEQTIYITCFLEPFWVWGSISTSKANAGYRWHQLLWKITSSNTLQIKLIKCIADTLWPQITCHPGAKRTIDWHSALELPRTW